MNDWSSWRAADGRPQQGLVDRLDRTRPRPGHDPGLLGEQVTTTPCQLAQLGTASSIGPPARPSRIAVPDRRAASMRSGSGLRRDPWHSTSVEHIDHARLTRQDSLG
jgi:hypothetical protein